MRHSIFCLIVLMSHWSWQVNAQQEPNDKFKVDSIIEMLEGLPYDSLMIHRHSNAYQSIINSSDSKRLLAYSLQVAKANNDLNMSIQVWFDYYRYYHNRTISDSCQIMLDSLKMVSYESGNYRHYFSCRKAFAEICCSRGMYQWALEEADKMRDEALEVGWKNGEADALITEGNVCRFKYDYRRAIEMYESANEIFTDVQSAKGSTYSRIIECLIYINEYEKALENCHRLEKHMKCMEITYPHLIPRFRNRNLEVHLLFSEVLYNKGELEEMRKRLDMSREYYDERAFITYDISYHELWGLYFHSKGQFGEALKHLDIAIDKVGQREQPRLRFKLAEDKASLLFDWGKERDGIEMMKNLLDEKRDHNNNIVNNDGERLDSNIAIATALREREEQQWKLAWIRLGAMGVMMVVLIVIAIHLFRIRKELVLAQERTHAAKLAAERIREEKETYLRSVSDDVREHLNNVTNSASVIFGDKEPDVSEHQRIIRDSAAHLMEIVGDVLARSRQEARRE